jgi:hypothetical protein
MKALKGMVRPSVFVVGALIAHIGLATPILCSPGYQDATCLTPFVSAAAPAPACRTDPGWTTTAPAVWQGSQWSQPQCSYQAQQVCPVGTTTVSPSTWTGSSWTQPTCQVQAPQPPQALTPADLAASCNQYARQRGFFSDGDDALGNYVGPGPNVFTPSGLLHGNEFIAEGELPLSVDNPVNVITDSHSGMAIVGVECMITPTGTITLFLYNYLSDYTGG